MAGCPPFLSPPRWQPFARIQPSTVAPSIVINEHERNHKSSEWLMYTSTYHNVCEAVGKRKRTRRGSPMEKDCWKGTLNERPEPFWDILANGLITERPRNLVYITEAAPV